MAQAEDIDPMILNNFPHLAEKTSAAGPGTLAAISRLWARTEKEMF